MVTQAIHWFDFDSFYSEVTRCLRPNGLIVVVGYSLLEVKHTGSDQIIRNFYQKIRPYWEPERIYVDNAYDDIPFPFTEFPRKVFSTSYFWSRDHLLGYIRTWSGVNNYMTIEGVDPTLELEENLSGIWESQDQKECVFTFFTRIGKLKTN